MGDGAAAFLCGEHVVGFFIFTTNDLTHILVVQLQRSS